MKQAEWCTCVTPQWYMDKPGILQTNGHRAVLWPTVMIDSDPGELMAESARRQPKVGYPEIPTKKAVTIIQSAAMNVCTGSRAV